MKSIITIICLIISLVFSKSLPGSNNKHGTCQSCHPIDETKINVHLIPHSHDDVGWLKTVDEYYYGSRRHVQFAGIRYIISSAIQALKGHPERRFIQVETAYFWQWWQDQEDALKQEVIELINSGQLEIINGGWSMNDEAVAHYQSIIDQFTWGFRFLNDTFGECARPKIGWQIDPFGHSREHASIINQLGFQGLILGRIDYRDKEKRRKDKNLDFIWQTSTNLDNSNIFTTILPDFYLSPKNYCFDILCDDEPINDNDKSPGYNVKEKVNGFIDQIKKYKDYYQTSNFLVPMGGDFNYQAAEINFANIDKLIKGFKDHDTYNVFYSTPSCYIRAVNDEINRNGISLKTKFDDFFPYADSSHAFWTGYFTSRPTSKRLERMGNNILQVSKQLTAFSRIHGKDHEEAINYLRRIMGVMQHHDAITGTEKEAVFKDYTRMLTMAIRNAEAAAGTILLDLLKKQLDHQIDFSFSSCLLANISICENSNRNQFLVAVYNPLSREVTQYVRLPINETKTFKILGPDGEEDYDIFEAISKFDYVTEKVKSTPYELIFAAKQIPPLGVKLYHIKKFEDNVEKYQNFQDIKEDFSFGTETNGFTIDNSTGRLSSVTLRGITQNVTQDFFYYSGATGTYHKASGAYIFRVNDPEPKLAKNGLISVKAKKGILLDEVLQIFNSEITQIIRVYKSVEDQYIEFDWLIGDLKTSYNEGREVVTRFTVANFTNNQIFFTDSNGREQMKRELNKRNDFDYNPKEESVASNYYPITSKIVIKDETKKMQVAVLTDRSQGGSSLHEGTIELLVHRRLVRDDGFGVGEPLNEQEYDRGLYVRGQHFFTFGTSQSATVFERDLAARKILAPWIGLSGPAPTYEETQNLLNFQFSGLTKALPKNVQILTLEPWRDENFLLRLEHTFEKGEDAILSQEIVLHLEDLFANFDISAIGETTLGANQWLDDYDLEEKFIWNNETTISTCRLEEDDPLKIKLKPMQIRTFLIKVAKK